MKKIFTAGLAIVLCAACSAKTPSEPASETPVPEETAEPSPTPEETPDVPETPEPTPEETPAPEYETITTSRLTFEVYPGCWEEGIAEDDNYGLLSETGSGSVTITSENKSDSFSVYQLSSDASLDTYVDAYLNAENNLRKANGESMDVLQREAAVFGGKDGILCIVKTIDIFESEYTSQFFIIADENTLITITCGADSEEFDSYREEFQHLLESISFSD